MYRYSGDQDWFIGEDGPHASLIDALTDANEYDSDAQTVVVEMRVVA